MVPSSIIDRISINKYVSGPSATVALIRPALTSKTCARADDVGEGSADRRRSSRPARRARPARRRAPRAASDRDGRPPRRAAAAARTRSSRAINPACASTSRISSAFCSPVEASAAGMSFRAVHDREIGQMRTVERAAGGGVARAAFAQERRGSDPRPRSRAAVGEASLDPALRVRSAANGNAESSSRAGCERSLQAFHRLGAQAATATASSAVSCSTASSQCASGLRLFQQPVARAQGSLERRHAARMLGIDRQHQPVEKAPALGGRPGEQLVHRRRQPDHAQMVGEGRGRADRLRGRCGICASVAGFAGGGGSMPVPSVARPSAPSISADTAQDAVAFARSATSSSVARRRPRPGARNEIASIKLVLPAPFGAGEHDRPVADQRSTRRGSCGNSSASRRRMRAAVMADVSVRHESKMAGQAWPSIADLCSGRDYTRIGIST